MDIIEITSLDDDAIAAAVREWLTNTELPDDSTLGAWLVTDAWTDWKYTASELVGEVAGLAIGASSDMYDDDPAELRLFSVTQDSDGERYELDWTESDFTLSDDPAKPTVITFVVDHYNDATPDTESQSSDLSPITVDPAALLPAFADQEAAGSDELIDQRVAVLVEQVTRVLVHLREQVLKLPITIAA